MCRISITDITNGFDRPLIVGESMRGTDLSTLTVADVAEMLNGAEYAPSSTEIARFRERGKVYRCSDHHAYAKIDGRPTYRFEIL